MVEILRATGVTKVFGSGETEVRAVDGVDLSVEAGQLVLIMGPSGSGKTTLLTIIGGLLRPTSGSVAIDGIEITSLSERELAPVRRRKVGFIFQAFNLWETLSVQENVELVLNMAGVSGPPARERAHTLLEERGLRHRLSFRSRDLSGGEKQRVSIARALANEPRLLLADEPTANLDSKHGRDVMHLLKDLAGSGDRAVIAVSHDERIREVADRVLWLEDGRIKDIGRMVRDPVCGMSVEVERSVAVEYQGRTFHFCSRGCGWEFQASPARFTAAQGMHQGPSRAQQHPSNGEEVRKQRTMSSFPRSFSLDEASKIGEALGIDWAHSLFDAEQFRMGLDVELEHGRRDPETDVTHDDPMMTGKIALAHLNEFPDYYIRLATMEGGPSPPAPSARDVLRASGYRHDQTAMDNASASKRDPAERSAHMRLFYRDWHPTRLGRVVNRVWSWWAGLGLPPRILVTLEAPGRNSGRTRANVLVVATHDGHQYLVSMLGDGSEWVKNVRACGGRTVIKRGKSLPIFLAEVPPAERAPILKAYARVATSGRHHFPVRPDATLSEFAAIAARYPVFRIDPPKD